MLAERPVRRQTIDARRATTPGSGPVRRPTGWVGVHAARLRHGRLTPYVGPPVRARNVLPVRIWTSPSGRTLVDFGQNLVGWVRVRVTGRPVRGHIRHAEVLEHDELGTRPLRTAQATDRFVLSGERGRVRADVHLPRLPLRRGRGLAGRARRRRTSRRSSSHSDLRRIGTFAAPTRLLNQLHSNVVWGLRGNFLDVPTDCPQRDERLGWTGDIAVFAPTAAFLFDVGRFLARLARRPRARAAGRGRHGAVRHPRRAQVRANPARLPGTPSRPPSGATRRSGCRGLCGRPTATARCSRRQYPSMAAHVRRVESLLSPNGLWDKGFQFGDWLDPTAPPEDPIRAQGGQRRRGDGLPLPVGAHGGRHGRAARPHAEDAEAFADLASRIRDAFVEHYVTTTAASRATRPPSTRSRSSSACSTTRMRPLAGDRLAELAARGRLPHRDGLRRARRTSPTP